MIENKTAASFFLSVLLHAGAGAGLAGWAFLPPALPVKTGLSSLELDLRPEPVPVASPKAASVLPAPARTSDLSVIPSSSSFVIPEKAGIQSPEILDSRNRWNDSGGGGSRGGGNDSQKTQNNHPVHNADPLDKGVREAEILGKLQPRYPWLSRKKGEEGEVVLALRVSAEGRVENCRVVKSSGFERLDRAAVEELVKARFSPALRFGVPVPSSKQCVFEFRLEK